MLGLPTISSVDEVRQLFKGTLQGERDVMNVQVAMEESSLFIIKIPLTDKDGVFLETKPLSLVKPQRIDRTCPDMKDQLAEALAKNAALAMELVELHKSLSEVKEQKLNFRKSCMLMVTWLPNCKRTFKDRRRNTS